MTLTKMYKFIIVLVGLFILPQTLLFGTEKDLVDVGLARPLSYIASYETDLNKDSRSDLVFLVRASQKIKLLVLLNKRKGYKSYVLFETDEKINPALKILKSSGIIKSTKAGPDSEKKVDYSFQGNYINLIYPEGASVAFFWDKRKFRKVFLAD